MDVEGQGTKRLKRCNLLVERDIEDMKEEECDTIPDDVGIVSSTSGCRGLDISLLGSLPASAARR